MTRTEIQEQAATHFKLYNRILYEHCTGLGKSLTSINCIELHGGYWHIFVAEISHINNWIEEFKKFNKEYLLDKITFSCYQSMKKNLNHTNYIFDEAHRTYSELRFEYLIKIKENNPNKIIFLTATITRYQKQQLRFVFNNLFIHSISLSEAIEQEILPEPIVYFIGVNLNNTDKVIKFNFNKDKFVMCTELEYYQRISNRIEYLKQVFFNTQTLYAKNSWLSTANKRKKFLSTVKTWYSQKILSKYQDKRLLCFCGDIEQCNRLSNGHSIHSKVNKEIREKLIKDFNNNKVHSLFAVKMMKEGLNLYNVELSIILQLDNVGRYMAQILGRSLRSIAPIQYVLYVKNTQDEVYVNTALENFNKKYVKFIDYNEI